jgi:hypothetical protein
MTETVKSPSLGYEPHLTLDHQAMMYEKLINVAERLDRLERVLATLRRKVYNG